MTDTTTKKKFQGRFVVLAFAGALVFQGAAAADELNALVWCDHTNPEIIRPFEEKHTVTVNLKEYEGTGPALALVEQPRPIGMRFGETSYQGLRRDDPHAAVHQKIGGSAHDVPDVAAVERLDVALADE